MVTRNGGSVMARVVARLLELAIVVPAMEGWVQALQPGEAFCAHGELPDEASGSGLVEAARGSLGHWLSIRRGRIARAGVVFHWRFRGQAVEVDTPSSKAAAVSEQVAENPKATNGETV